MWFTVSRSIHVLQYQPMADPGYPRRGVGGHTNPKAEYANLLFWPFFPKKQHQFEKKNLTEEGVSTL